MSRNKMCPECQKGVLYKKEYVKDEKVFYKMVCPKCDYEEKLSSLRESRGGRNIEDEEE